jgi:hypothetical protein
MSATHEEKAVPAPKASGPHRLSSNKDFWLLV